ncbi:MAG: ribonucleoside-diphosphate reductase subunit alpha [Candidatus Roizmanbacteria bacterium]
MENLYADLKHINPAKVLAATQGLHAEDAATTVAYIPDDPEYQLLAGRMRHVHLQSQLVTPYSKALLQDSFDKIIDNDLVRFVIKHSSEIDAIIEQDTYSVMKYNWMAIRTLEKGYLKQITNQITNITKPLEDVRYAIMRMAVFIFMKMPSNTEALHCIRKFYDYVSKGAFSPASPTWFHAGTKFPQMKSCFLTEVDDNIESIMKAYTDTALISKEGGGNGVHVTKLRHSTVRSAGKSAGIRPWMKMWNEQAVAINQGGNRKGAFTFFLALWHKDTVDFIDLRLPDGNPDFRTPHLNVCCWVPDLFFKRVLDNENWSMFCPKHVPGLTECWGEDFERMYLSYEGSNTPRITIKAQQLMSKICSNMIVSGEPFIMAGDTCNRKSNQQHDCVHQGSNLCLEIIEKASETQIAACNLASLCLPYFVVKGTLRDSPEGDSSKVPSKAVHFDFSLFREVCKFVTIVLNRISGSNFYPVDRIKRSDELHSPIGVGTQGFANVLAAFDLPWMNELGDGPNQAALALKEKIWACKYYATMEQSCEMARLSCHYSSFKGSPLSMGKFQFDLWQEEFTQFYELYGGHVGHVRSRNIVEPKDWGQADGSWQELRTKVMKYGVVNSLLGADMPTATTAHIQNNMESFEPFTYNYSARRVLAGDCYVFNENLFADLEILGLRNLDTVEFLVRNNGSLQGFREYLTVKGGINIFYRDRVSFLERKYLTSYEMPTMIQQDFVAVSSPYVCQSTSFNLHMKDPGVNDIYNLLMRGWMLGLKTLAYYTRTETAVDPIKYTIRGDDLKAGSSDNVSVEAVAVVKKSEKEFKCEGDVCTMCDG